MRKRLVIVLAGLAVVIAAWVLAFGGIRAWIAHAFYPDPTSIARASLEAVREQNRLTPFVARFVAVVTSEQHRFGFAARKTLIMPGLVRYEVDLGRLQQRDVRWDASAHVLAVTLPAVEIAGPQVDLTAIREYGEGGVLMTLTDAEKTLDAANRKVGQAELLRQAQEALPMRLARDAARSAIERSFAMPLKATGIDATVTVKFAGE